MKKNISTQLEKIIEWLIYISVIIVPLIFLPQVNSVFAESKLFVFRVITLLIILLWAFSCLFADKIRVRFAKFFWFVIAYAAISIVNTFVTINIVTSLFGTYGRFLGIFTVINLLFWVYIVFSFLNTREKILKLMWFSVITAFVVAFYGLLQYFDLFVNIIPWTMDPMDRVFSTIGHSNHTAAYLGMNLMLLLPLILNEEKKKKKVLMWIGFALIALTLILTASRGGVFAVIFTGIIWMIFILKSKKLSKKTFKYSIFCFLIAAVFGIILSGPISKIGVVERTTSTITFVLQGHMPDRVSWWLSSLEMIADKPFLGYGLSSFKDVYNQYRRTDYRVPDDLQDNITPETAHNEYLNITATQGIIGILIYLAMLFELISASIKYIKKADQKDKIVVLGLLTALLVYLIEVFISFGTVPTLFVVFTIMGLLISYINLHVRIGDFKINMLFKIIILLVAIVVSGVFGYHSINEIRADYTFKQAIRYGVKGDVENAIIYFEKVQSLMPQIAEYYEGHAAFLFEFAIRLPEQLQGPYLLDANEVYIKAMNANDSIPNIVANRSLILSRLADLNRNNEKIFNEYKQLAIAGMTAAALMAENNPFYSYKAAQMHEYFELYDAAAEFYYDTLKIRPDYKNVKDKVSEYSDLISAHQKSAAESGDWDSQQQPETAAY